MSTPTFPRAASLLCISLFAISACSPSDSPTAVDHLTAHANRGVAGDAKSAHVPSSSTPGAMFNAARSSTSRYHASNLAARDGYVAPAECVAHPLLGGMGFHWASQSLVDPVFEPTRPEALLYAPGNGKRPKLVGVEYIVLDVGQPRPEFDGQPFDIGGVKPLMDAKVPHWSLHVWLYESNPNGLYTPFNPNVRCN